MERVVESSLRHLRVFETVAKLQNVRKAAEAVHLTQPAVTQAIAKLESQVNAILFERRSSGTYLTAAGEMLASRIGRMFDQIEDALQGAGVVAGASSFIADRITRPQIRALSVIAKGYDAGDVTGISRPSLHRAARELERSLGKRLLYRSANGLSTTETGSDLARRLTIAMLEIEWALEEIAAESESRGGRLRVGAMPLTGSFVMGPVLNDLTNSFPNADVEVRSGDRQALIAALQRGEIDLIVGLLCGTTDLSVFAMEPLVSLPYVLVARPDHPLAALKKVRLQDLEGYSWVAPNANTARRAAFDQLARSLRTPPKANIQASSLSTVRLVLSGSDRLALLTRFEAEQERGAEALTVLSFGPIEPAPTLGLMRRVNWLPTPLHMKFIELVRAHAATIGTDGAAPAKEAAA